ncbi:MAG: hypothetical protein ABSB74_10505 [Tepidisphaeraceae bacterium]
MNSFAAIFALFAVGKASAASSRFHFVLFFTVIVCAGRAVADDSLSVPFYYAAGTTLDLQISTLVVGVNESAGQAVRSDNRKYASLNVDTSLLGSAAVRGFRYQKGGSGFVGSAAASQNMPASAANGMTPSIAALPSQIAPPVSILDKLGMVLVMPLER